MTTTPALPPIIASRYVPVRLIAKGGMGAVYEVEHVRTGERLALKVLLTGVGSSAEAVERFKREARASARIKSEHVVRVTDADVAPELDGAPFLVMELLEGMDLERSAAESPPAPETVIVWLRQVAQAIDKAHRLGIIHRDLKPENLFLAIGEDRRPVVKVLDFGIAKMVDDGTGATGTGQVVGTPRYMAPEQASPNAPVTPATDRCALGLVAYRLLLGESYYQGGTMSILGQILHAELQLPSARGSRFGRAFDTWFLKACHRSPEQRFASTSEQIEGLAEALGLPHVGGAVTLPAALPASPASAMSAQAAAAPIAPSRSRRPVAVAVFVVVGLAVVSLAGLLLRRRGGASEAGSMPTAVVPARPAALPVPPPVHPEPVRPPTLPPPPTETPIANTRVAPALPTRGPTKARAARRQVADEQPIAGARPPTETPKVADPYADQK